MDATDCTGQSGYVPDPYNCRRYWLCDPGLPGPPKHFLCDLSDENGRPMMYDLEWSGCNHDYLTDCGDRPVCDECNANCN